MPPSQAIARILGWSAARSWSVTKGMAVLLNKRGAESKLERRLPCFVFCLWLWFFAAAAPTSHQTALLRTGHGSLQDGWEPIRGLGLRRVHGHLYCSSVDVA